MKKIYLTLATSIFAVGLFAQAPMRVEKNPVTGVKILDNKQVNKTFKELNPSPAATSRATTISEYVSAIDLVTDFYGTGSARYLAYTNPIFPDSNVMIAFTSSTSAPWLYAVAQTIDLNGFYATEPGKIFDPAIQPFDATDTFNIDSISIQGYYNRLNMSVVDTAVISVYADGNGNYTRGYWVSNPDSTKLLIDYTTKGNVIAADSAIATYKIILDNAFFNDTLAAGNHNFEVASALTVTGGHRGRVGVSIHFVPGKTYSQATDTLFTNSNSIRIVYCTPMGQNATFPNGAGPDLNIGSFNSHSYQGGAPYQFSSRYGTFNFYNPPINFVGDHPYQLYDVNIKVSQVNALSIGIKELSNNATLLQNFPNPASSFTTVRYSLENQAQVTFEMMDVTGKKVMAITEGNKTAGTHSIEINTDQLNAGIYFYSVVVDGNRITKKMTITK